MNLEALRRYAPGVFVLLWSSGFIVARYGTADAGPLTFLTVRTAVAACILLMISRLAGESRLTRPQIRVQAVVGFGIHACYLGGVFVAIDHGLPSGVSALIAALHPVVTSVLAFVLLGEVMASTRVVGIVLGFVGVVAVVVDKGSSAHGVTSFQMGAMTVAVVGMSAGTLVQRRHAGATPLLAGTACQYFATSLVLGVAAVLAEGWNFTITARSLFSLVWAVGVLSIAAVLIMLWLLRRKAAVQVSSLFFLTPALSTVEGAILFGERLGVLSIVGLFVAIAGVWLATREASVTSPPR